MYRALRQVAVARDFPFVVKTTVPPGGFGKRLNAMHSFHRDRGIQLAILPHQHDAGGNYLLWCFDSPPIAEKFAEEFSSFIRDAFLYDARVALRPVSTVHRE